MRHFYVESVETDHTSKRNQNLNKIKKVIRVEYNVKIRNYFLTYFKLEMRRR